MEQLIFLGDVCIKEPINQSIFDSQLQDVINKCALVSCNFEGPLASQDGRPIAKAGQHVFQSRQSLECLIQSGINFFNLANNHIMDFGEAGLLETLKYLGNFPYCGVGKDPISASKERIFEINGTKIALLSFCEQEFGVLGNFCLDEEKWGAAYVNHFSTDRHIFSLKKAVDIVIVQTHAGVEEEMLPLPEWRLRYRALIDAGADLVIGHHPHVPQGWEVYKGKSIFYSLGNCFFDLESSTKLWNHSLGVVVSIQNKQLERVDVLPLLKNERTVSLCKDKGYYEYLQKLCKFLQSARYEAMVNDRCISLWENRYSNYYRQASNLLFSQDKTNHAFYGNFLLHNIQIESHRWVVERALRLLYG